MPLMALSLMVGLIQPLAPLAGERIRDRDFGGGLSALSVFAEPQQPPHPDPLSPQAGRGRSKVASPLNSFRLSAGIARVPMRTTVLESGCGAVRGWADGRARGSFVRRTRWPIFWRRATARIRTAQAASITIAERFSDRHTSATPVDGGHLRTDFRL